MNDIFKKKPILPDPNAPLNNAQLKQIVADRLVNCLGLDPTASGYNLCGIYICDRKLLEAIASDIILLCIHELQLKINQDLFR